ncbi:MAG: HAD family hydrolase [Pseudonocardiaceae bacterium]
MKSVDDTIRQSLSSADAVLFDFDGPLCNVFAGLPAPTVTRQLEALTGRTFDTDDPLEVVRQAAEMGAVMLAIVEDALVAAELKAVSQSVAEAGGVSAVSACLASGFGVGVVSNNSAPAVTAFLDVWDLAGSVAPVVGRVAGRPELMKPNPWPLRRALEQLEIAPERAVFVGDSTSDIEAASRAGVPCLAFANKPYKFALFEGTGAVVISSMWDLAAAVREAPRGSASAGVAEHGPDRW